MLRFGRNGDVVFALVVFVLVTVVSCAVQERITYQQGRGFDGSLYWEAARQIENGESIRGPAPWVYRLGTPFLVSLLPGRNRIERFAAVNVAAGALATLLLVLWLRPYVPSAVHRCILVTMFATQWHGPVRYVHYYPTYTDPWFFVFVLLGLLLAERQRREPGALVVVAMIGVAALGVAFREACLLPALAFCLAEPGPVRGAAEGARGSEGGSSWRWRVYRLLPAAAALAVLFSIRAAVEPTSPYDFVETALGWARQKSPRTYLHAWFIAFGPVLVLLLHARAAVARVLRSDPVLLFYLSSIALLAWVGGSDTERILYWSMPVVFVLLGSAMQETTWPRRSVPLLTTLVLAQAVSQRVFWTTPDFPGGASTAPMLLTPWGCDFPFLELHSFYGQRAPKLVSLLQYVATSALLLFWMHRSSPRRPA